MKRKFLNQTKYLVKSLLPDTIWVFLRNNPLKKAINQKKEITIYRKWAAANNASLKELNNISLENGVNIIGHLTAGNGLGEAARCTIKSLKFCSIPFFAFDLEYFPETNHRIESFPYKINIIHVNPDKFSSLWGNIPPNVLTDRYTIAVWYWELPEFPQKWVKLFDLVDEIWVASEFVRNSIQKKTNKIVRIVPPAIHVEVDDSITREDFGLPENVFLFLCAYDTYSVQARKNPLGSITAFTKAFSPKDENVGLVVKVNHASYNQKEVDKLKKQLSHYKHCYFLEESYPRQKFNALINLIDSYISLHRSEGFGLIPAESMYLGKPVIMTNWSGNLDFTREDNSCPVGYKLIPVGKGVDVYDSRQFWADPDPDQAAEYMKKLVSDKIFYKKISQNAAISIRELYGPKVIAEKIKNLVQQTFTLN